MLYTVNNRCVEVPELECNDGLKFLYFNTKGRNGGSESIRNVLEYMQNSREESAIDKATKEINKCVNNVRLDPAIRGKYMTFGEKLDRTYIEGQKNGQKIGQKEGKERLLINMICKKLIRGMSVTDIAEDLEIDKSEIARIYEVAEKFAPEYDQEAIYNELQKELV